MISALAPAWQYQAVEALGYEPLVLDVDEVTGLVTAEIVSKGMQAGGRLLILHETEGILPDFDGIMQLGVQVIEDISLMMTRSCSNRGALSDSGSHSFR